MRTRLTALPILATVLTLSAPIYAQAQRGQSKDPSPRSRHRTSITVPSLPSGYRAVVVAGTSYYFSSGVFYRRNASGFTVVAAPVGARIDVLPRGHSTVVIAGVTYYHYYGTYYRHVHAAGDYIVVEPPVAQPAVDVVRLINGDVLEGKFVSGDETSIRFETAGEIHHIPLQQVVSIDFEAPGSAG